MTRRAIEGALPFWKRLLRLEDWTIEVRTGKAAEMCVDGEECEGLNYFHPEEARSLILLRRGVGEDTLVHELLHIVLDGDRPRDEQNYDCLHERAINRIAAALMELRHNETN